MVAIRFLELLLGISKNHAQDKVQVIFSLNISQSKFCGYEDRYVHWSCLHVLCATMLPPVVYYVVSVGSCFKPQQQQLAIYHLLECWRQIINPDVARVASIMSPGTIVGNNSGRWRHFDSVSVTPASLNQCYFWTDVRVDVNVHLSTSSSWRSQSSFP